VAACDDLAAVLSRLVEGDASPDEALAVARHLPDCTACRIRLAREGRLHRALSGLNDAVGVDDGFVEGVMSALPPGPPARPRGNRRRIRIAVGAGLMLLFTWWWGVAGRDLAPSLGVAHLMAADWDTLANPGPLDSPAGVARTVGACLEVMRLGVPQLSFGAWSAALAPAAALLLVAGAALTALLAALSVPREVQTRSSS
jgi:anti-sigma factor RsiW